MPDTVLRHISLYNLLNNLWYYYFNFNIIKPYSDTLSNIVKDFNTNLRQGLGPGVTSFQSPL